METYDNGLSFICDLRRIVYEQEKESLSNLYEGNLRTYTELISNIINNLILEKGLKNYPEYFKIDYTGWTIREASPINGTHIYDWDFDFAIEHENDHTDWTYELLKLSFIRASVRIVIGYVENNVRDGEIQTIREQVSKFIYPVSNKEKYFVVLMNRKIDAVNDPFYMRVYEIKGIKVSEITSTIKDA